MNNLTRYIIGIALVAIVLSCEREQEPKESTNFSFDRIEYSRRYGERMEESVKTGYPMTIYNNTSTEQSYVFNPDKNIYDRVTFSVGYGFDGKSELVGKEQRVKIPTLMNGDGFQYDDGSKWFYLDGDQELRPDLDSETILPIPSHHAITITPSFTQVSFLADYKIYLKGDEYGEEIVVEGSYGGLFTVDYELTHFTFPIE